MNTWQSRWCDIRRLTVRPLTLWAGRHTRMGTALDLIYKKDRKPDQKSGRTVVLQQTICKTVVNHRQTVHQHILHRSAVQYLHTDAFLLLLPPQPQRQGPELEADPARPTRTTRRLLHIFSMDSAQRLLRPFYSDVVRRVLGEEQARYRSRPSQAISLIWNLFGRQQAFRTLTHFYLSAVERLGSHYYPALQGQNALYLAAGVVLHSQLYRRYVRQLWSQEGDSLPLQGIRRQPGTADRVLDLQVARRALPPQEPLERMAQLQEREEPQREPVRVQELHLSEADFRALVQGVALSLGRQTRIETLRRGGG